MKTQLAQQITAYIALAVMVAILAVAAAPARLHAWARSGRERGELVSSTIFLASMAVLAVAAGAFIAAKVWEHLNRIQ